MSEPAIEVFPSKACTITNQSSVLFGIFITMNFTIFSNIHIMFLRTNFWSNWNCWIFLNVFQQCNQFIINICTNFVFTLNLINNIGSSTKWLYVCFNIVIINIFLNNWYNIFCNSIFTSLIYYLSLPESPYGLQ